MHMVVLQLQLVNCFLTEWQLQLLPWFLLAWQLHLEIWARVWRMSDVLRLETIRHSCSSLVSGELQKQQSICQLQKGVRWSVKVAKLSKIDGLSFKMVSKGGKTTHLLFPK